MVEISIAPATRFDDVEHALTGGGDGHRCQCQWWTLTAGEWNRTPVPEREERLRDEVAAHPAPGLVGYVDGEAAGWVRVGPRTAQARLARTRNFAKTEEPWGDPTVWAVTCFVVRKEHRRTGLNAALLNAAIEFARENGARVIEGYPIDPHAGRRRSSNELFHGVVSTFLSAGFREVDRPRPDLAIVALDLGD